MSMVPSLLGCQRRDWLRDSCETGTSSHTSKMGHTLTNLPTQPRLLKMLTLVKTKPQNQPGDEHSSLSTSGAQLSDDELARQEISGRERLFSHSPHSLHSITGMSILYLLLNKRYIHFMSMFFTWHHCLYFEFSYGASLSNVPWA